MDRHSIHGGEHLVRRHLVASQHLDVVRIDSGDCEQQGLHALDADARRRSNRRIMSAGVGRPSLRYIASRRRDPPREVKKKKLPCLGEGGGCRRPKKSERRGGFSVVLASVEGARPALSGSRGCTGYGLVLATARYWPPTFAVKIGLFFGERP
jgi:hypothetical protein